MSLNVNEFKGSSSKPPAPALDPGNYPARLVRVLYLGIQPQNPFKGEPKPPGPEFMTTYELLDEFLENEDGEPDTEKPRWISERFVVYPLTSENSKSTKRYLSLDPEAKFKGDWSSLLGAPCYLTITKRPSKKDPSREYNNVASVQPMRAKEATKAPALVNEASSFDFNNPNLEVFLALPTFVQDIVKGAVNFPGSPLEDLLSQQGVEETKKEVVKEEVEDNDDSTEW